MIPAVQLRRQLHLQLDENGDLTVWAPHHMWYFEVGSEDFAMLRALGAGAKAPEALRAAGISALSDEDVTSHLQKFIAAGILEIPASTRKTLVRDVGSIAVEGCAVAVGALVGALRALRGRIRWHRELAAHHAARERVEGLDLAWTGEPHLHLRQGTPGRVEIHPTASSSAESQPVTQASSGVSTVVYPLT